MALVYDKKDCFIVEGKLALPYSYFAGRVGSTFITTLRDKKKIMGVKCPVCNKVYLPPRQTCERDLTDIRDNWVEVQPAGEVVNFTVVRYDDKYLPRKAPFVMALIKLDGADTPIVHILDGVSPEEVVIGMKVEAVFSSSPTNTILDIAHFAPKKPEKVYVSQRKTGAKEKEGAQPISDEEKLKQERRKGMSKKVIITAALSGAATMKNQNQAVPYTPQEFAEESYKCYKAGAAMIHVHAREDNGMPTHDHKRIKDTHDAIKEKCPELIVNLSSAVGMGKTPEQRISQILYVKPEMASLNTNTMNFSIVDRKTGKVFIDFIFENTFTMLQDFGKAMEENNIKPEVEVYDLGGLDNWFLIAKQGFFTKPYNFNFVWGVAGGMEFRPDMFMVLKNALPEGANFTTCGVGTEQFPSINLSCMVGGHMRVGLEDNIRIPTGVLAKGSYEQVEWAVKIAQILGREPATPDEAREIMGLKKQ